MRHFAPLILVLAMAGCTSSWADLAEDATPSFRSGPCGPELVWRKEVAVYDAAIVEGVVVVKQKCKAEQEATP